MAKGKGGAAGLESNSYTGFEGNGIKDAGKKGGKNVDPGCNDTWGVKGHGIDSAAATGGKLMPLSGNGVVGFEGKGIVDAGK